MIVVPRLSSRARRRSRAAGAAFAAAAVLPWLAVVPTAQAQVLPRASDDVIVSLCHANSSDSPAYEYLELPASVVLSVHLEHRNNPTATWQGDVFFQGHQYHAGDPKPDIISDFDNLPLDNFVTPQDCGESWTSSTTTRTKPPTTTTTTSTTTTTTTTTTTRPPTTTTTTTTPPTTTTTTTTPPTTTTTSTTTSPSQTATVLPTKATNTPSTSPAEVSAENAVLPRTGSDVGQAALLSLLLLGLGGVLLRVSGMRLQRPRKH